LGDNTDVQIDISSVNGTANIFARRRQAGQVWYSSKSIASGVTRVFIFDWRDHPAKTQEWYDKRKTKAEAEGLGHIFAQEVDRDYAAAVAGILIPAKWVKAAIDIHKKIDLPIEGASTSSLDVADEGGDLNAYTNRKGITLKFSDKWAQGDTGQTANKAVTYCKLHSASSLQYDCIGVGSGIKSETNRLKRDNQLPRDLDIVPWNAAGSVLHPDVNIIPGDTKSPLNKDLYSNLKAQGGWKLRVRFEKTYKVITQGATYPLDELINIKSTVPFFHEIIQELSQPTYSHNGAGKIVIDKKPEGTKSPNLYDSIVQNYWPWITPAKKAGVWGSKK